MGDVYRFRSGDPINRDAMRRFLDLCISARDAGIMAQSFDGHDDQRRDDFLDTAAASLSAAQAALVKAMTPPEPPRVAPIRAGLVDVMFDIAGGAAPVGAA